MYTRAVMVLAVMSVWLLGGQLVWAQQHSDKEHAELAKVLKDAKVSLAKGLTASEREGQPISGKFEVEHGKLQLSVYTMQGEPFSEVIVDHTTGRVAGPLALIRTLAGHDPEILTQMSETLQ
jgi:hypothetical protein